MTAGARTATERHRTTVSATPVRAEKAIVTSQKYGKIIGNETAIRKAYRATALDWRSERARAAIRSQSTGAVGLE
jgi:hypothetical protein